MSQTGILPPSMPTQKRSPALIVDLSSIDLSKKILTREDLEEWNPHRGAMALLDGVVWCAKDFKKIVGVKHVREDEFWVKGHFPGHPLFPGVLMVEAGAQLVNYAFFSRSGTKGIAVFTRIQHTAFRGAVVPGDDLYILSKDIKHQPRRFVSDVQGVVKGSLVFESRITGMVLSGVTEA